MLPSRPDRVLLHAFALSAAMLTGGAVGVVTALAAAPSAGIVAGLVGASLLYIGARVRPDWLALAYQQWGRLMRAYARLARGILIRIIHYLLITPVARIGGDGGFWQSRAASGWFPHEPVAAGARRPRAWWRKSWSSSGGSSGAWAVTLVPLLAALRLMDRLDAQRSGEVPTAMYTLY